MEIKECVLREDGIHFIERDGRERNYPEYKSIEDMNSNLQRLGFNQFRINPNNFHKNS